MRYKLTEQTHVVKGLEIPYPEKVYPEYYYPDWSSSRDPVTNYPTGKIWKEPKVLFEAGVAFVPLHLLEELLEVENSYGMGGAFLINDSRVEWALESAGLINKKTRGGVHTNEEQRLKINNILEAARSVVS